MGQIDLPVRLNFQTSSADLEFKNALAKIVYPQQIPSPYFYPKSPYGVSGLGAHGDTPGPPYCTDFPDYASMLTYFGVELCNQSTPGDQYACALRNAPKLIQVANFQNDCSYPTSYQSGVIPVNPANPGAGGRTYTGTLPTTGGGSLIFNASRPGSVLQVGDTYTILVLGPPNSPVTATITFNGSTATSSQGNTGADGTFSTQGGITSSEVGTWHQVWTVGGQLAGALDFSVVAPGSAPAGNSQSPVTTPTTSNPPSTTPPVGAGYNPRVTFTPSRQGILYPGDTWSIQITGAAPRSSVSVFGGQNGANTTNQMGSTDGNGNFSLSGTVDTTSVGTWQETWYAGGQNAGSFSFVVANPQSTTPPGGSTGGGYTTPPGGTSQPTSGANPPAAAASDGSWIPGISNTVVGAGAGLLVLLVLMGGRR